MIDVVGLDGMPEGVAMLVPRDIAEQIRDAQRDPRAVETRKVVASILDEVKRRAYECAVARFTEAP